jgi:hypothetical protein
MMEISLESEGGKEFAEAMAMLARLGAKVYAAELLAGDRGWDFFSLGNDEDKVLQTIADDIVKQLDAFMDQGGASASQADSIAAGAYSRGLKKFAKTVVDRINKQRLADGSSPQPVSDGYAIWRQATYGIDPSVVGIATRDLLTNLATGTVKVRKGR